MLWTRMKRECIVEHLNQEQDVELSSIRKTFMVVLLGRVEMCGIVYTRGFLKCKLSKKMFNGCYVTRKGSKVVLPGCCGAEDIEQDPSVWGGRLERGDFRKWWWCIIELIMNWDKNMKIKTSKEYVGDALSKIPFPATFWSCWPWRASTKVGREQLLGWHLHGRSGICDTDC